MFHPIRRLIDDMIYDFVIHTVHILLSTELGLAVIVIECCYCCVQTVSSIVANVTGAYTTDNSSQDDR